VDHALQLLDAPPKQMWADLKRVAAMGDAEDLVRIILRNAAGRTVDLEISGGINHDTAMVWATAAGLAPDDMADFEAGTFKARALDGVTLSVATGETIDTLVTYNLLARIPGTTRPDETIVYSAHWDHVGVGADHVSEVSTTGDNIYNGAWDNASGTAGIVEMARQMAAAPRPERSIVFAHMAAEEMGLLGAYGYVANPVYPLETTVADINIDMLPLSPPTRDIAIFGKGQNSLEDSLAVLAAEEGRVITDDRQPEQGFYTRSDHFPFVRAGVPALMTWHGVDWDEGGIEGTDVVCGPEGAVWAGREDFHGGAGDGMEKIGSAPTVNKFAGGVEGGDVGGKDGELLLVAADEGGGDLDVLAAGGILTKNATVGGENSGQDIEIVCGCDGAAVEVARNVLAAGQEAGAVTSDPGNVGAVGGEWRRR
jgi:hypothetical protein